MLSTQQNADKFRACARAPSAFAPPPASGAIAIEHSEGGLEAVYITLEQQDGRWIVAEVIDFAPAA
jgi:hypothetical protein